MDSVTVTASALADTLSAELEIINTHLTHDRRICAEIADVNNLDNLHDLADRIHFNRNIIHTHLSRCEALLDLLLPTSHPDEGWLTVEELQAITEQLKSSGFTERTAFE